MAQRTVKGGSADQSCVINIIDSTDGTPETGVTFETTGIDLWYWRPGSTKTSITEATLASLDAAHSDGGIISISNGAYRLDLPDAAVAAGVPFVEVGGTLTDMIVIGCTLEIVADDIQVLLTGTASAGAATTITLTGGVATDGYYDGQLVAIVSGTGAGQARTILSYVGGTTVATVTRDWATAPDATSVFVVLAADIPAMLEAGTAQAGAASTITLDAGASATSAIYADNFIMLTAGTGIGQTRVIGAYDGGTKIATVVPAWTTTPDATSVYQIIPQGRVDVAAFAGQVCTTSTGNFPDVNVAEISDDSTAANNAELAFDGTGFGFTGCTMPTTTTATNVSTVNGLAASVITAASIAGDAITSAKIADNAIAGEHLAATACTKIIDDFETQSQADPTGFHVNVKEVNGTAQTANDNSADINDILEDTAVIGAAGVGLTAVGLADGAITAGKLGADCITNAKIADAAIGAENFAANALAAVWEELIADHRTAGSFGLYIAKGIPKNVAWSNRCFAMVDSGDNVTPKTGLTIEDSDAQVSKDGGAFANITGTVAEISAGIYQLDASQADMNADSLIFKFTATGASASFIIVETA